MNHKSIIQRNSQQITLLHSRVHETFASRDVSTEHRREWEGACSEFHTNYDSLAFVGGVETARQRLRDGDATAIEYALDFLEIRPYFFRSGYMYKDFMRVLRNCPLSTAQRKRYDMIHERYIQYRTRRNTAETPNVE